MTCDWAQGPTGQYEGAHWVSIDKNWRGHPGFPVVGLYHDSLNKVEAATPLQVHSQIIAQLAKSLRVKVGGVPQNTTIEQCLGVCITKLYRVHPTNFEAGPYHLHTASLQ